VAVQWHIARITRLTVRLPILILRIRFGI